MQCVKCLRTNLTIEQMSKRGIKKTIICKQCVCSDVKKIYNLKDKFEPLSGQLFTCSLCHKTNILFDDMRKKGKQKPYSCLECYRKQTSIFRNKNKDKINEQNREKMKIRRETDAIFRIKQNLRTRLFIAVKHKKGHTMELIGCSIDELIEHLTKQFTIGMSLQNYGKWHIDHIRPCASFNLENKDEQMKCFHYTNLQPLWALDNIKKGAKFKE